MLDCEKYNKGEAAVKEYLENSGTTVIDVSKNPAYWVQDVDFLAVKGKTVEKIEVKQDSYINSSQCFFIELMTDEARGKPGWIDITKADYIYYVDTKTLDCYIFSPYDMRQYLARNEYAVKRCYKDVYKVSSGAIIPLLDFAMQYQLDKITLKVPNKTV